MMIKMTLIAELIQNPFYYLNVGSVFFSACNLSLLVVI